MITKIRMIRTDDGYDDVCDSDGEWWMSTMRVILMFLIMMMINRYDQPSPSTPSATPCLSDLFRILHPSFGAVVVKPLNSSSLLFQLICSHHVQDCLNSNLEAYMPIYIIHTKKAQTTWGISANLWRTGAKYKSIIGGIVFGDSKVRFKT